MVGFKNTKAKYSCESGQGVIDELREANRVAARTDAAASASPNAADEPVNAAGSASTKDDGIKTTAIVLGIVGFVAVLVAAIFAAYNYRMKAMNRALETGNVPLTQPPIAPGSFEVDLGTRQIRRVSNPDPNENNE